MPTNKQTNKQANNKGKCVLCANSLYKTHWTELRNNIPGTVVECNVCGLKRLILEGTVDIEDFYRKNYSESYFKGSKSKSEDLFNTLLPIQHLKLPRIGKYLNSDYEVLEIGSSVGYTLKLIKDKVKKAIGLELNKEHAAYANSIGMETIDKPLTDVNFKEGTFDAIFMFQVLEHIPDPLAFLKETKRVLKPGGVLVVEVPTIHNPLISLYHIDCFKNFWYQAPHLLYFEVDTLRQLIEKASFQVLEIYTIQEASFINHVNWMLRKQPMPSRNDCVDTRLPLDCKGNIQVDLSLIKKIEELLQIFDFEYKSLLQRHGYGDILFCAAKK